MTTRTILFDNVSTPVCGAHTALAEPGSALDVPVFDLRSSGAMRAGRSDEFDIDDHVAGQDAETLFHVAQAGAWVAEQFYPREATLATLRLRAGLSQSELGARCGLRQPHISRYESGLHEPGVFQAQAMARALGVPLDELVQALKNGVAAK